MPLLEPTAICDTTKDSRDEVWIIDKREATEDLIFLRDVVVNTDVESVAMLVQAGAVAVVGAKGSVCRIGIKIQQLDPVGVKATGRDLIQIASGESKSGSARTTGAERVAETNRARAGVA